MRLPACGISGSWPEPGEPSLRQMRRGVHPTHCGRRRGIRCGGVDGAIVQGGRSPHVRERHAEGQSPGGWRPASQQVQHAAGRVRRDPAAQAWLNRALRDEQRKWFAADVIAVLGTPEPFREEDTDCRDRRTGSQFQQEIRRAVRACPRSSGSQGSPAADHRDRLRPRGGGGRESLLLDLCCPVPTAGEDTVGLAA